MTYDVIIIGGSYAGMAAALQLLRARRTVLVIDAGQRRNRMAVESHGFLGQDGSDPAEIARVARSQLERYPTLTWIEGTTVAASGARDGFTVTTGEGGDHQGRRLLLALGVSDALETPMGTQIRTSEAKETSTPGVFACGDAARVPHSISLAVGDGAWAGAQVHQSLVFAAAA